MAALWLSGTRCQPAALPEQTAGQKADREDPVRGVAARHLCRHAPKALHFQRPKAQLWLTRRKGDLERNRTRRPSPKRLISPSHHCTVRNGAAQLRSLQAIHHKPEHNDAMLGK